MDEPCQHCHSTLQVNWSLVHGWACAECRSNRTGALLGKPNVPWPWHRGVPSPPTAHP
jgi:hypothetical protein